jgi:hypothetical protein
MATSVRAGGAFTSPAVTPTTAAMIASSALAKRRNRRRPIAEAICARRRGTA